MNDGGAGVRTGLVVAVDGTSGSGKSSTSRGVAARLGLRYLDTGAQFRAVTWWMLHQGVDVHDPAAVAARADEPQVESGTDPADPTITVDGTDVAVAVRSDEVTRAVSPVSTVPEVRAMLLDLQRAHHRDRRRAERRHRRGGSRHRLGGVAAGAGEGPPLRRPRRPGQPAVPPRRAARTSRATEQVLRERDRIDSGRAVAPLALADGAVSIDTTAYTLDEVVGLVLGLVAADREEPR